MIALKFLLKFIQTLNKDASPQQIAGGMALGAIAGLTPLASLHNLVVLILVLMLRVNISSAILSLGVFSTLAYLLDPLFNKIGYLLLVRVEALKPLWTTFYNTPIVPWTRFNNTLTLGSLVFSLLLFWPLYFFLVWGVKTYRERVLAIVQRWKIVQVLKASKLYHLYQSYS
jgi:uncharacterized protein (TIGR03546 family)